MPCRGWGRWEEKRLQWRRRRRRRRGGVASRCGRHLHDVVDQRIFEHPVQSDAVVLQDVLHTVDTQGLTDTLADGQVDGGREGGRDAPAGFLWGSTR